MSKRASTSGAIGAWDSKDQDRKPAVGGKQDGRSLRETGRTEQFATRIRPETKAAIYAAAKRDGITMAELIERAIARYEQDSC